MTPLATTEEVTRLLHQWANGDVAALDRLMPIVYRELHKRAKQYMAGEDPGHTLQTTAVIHEAYLRLAGGAEQNWANRDHFFGVAAKAMRHVLVDHARKRQAGKRGEDIRRVTLDDALAVAAGAAAEMVALDDALEVLAKLDARKAQVVELRYFGGLNAAEIARILRVSPETVERDWKFAKSFLKQEINGGKKK